MLNDPFCRSTFGLGGTTCSLLVDHDGCHYNTRSEEAWVDGAKPDHKGNIKDRINKVRQATPSITDCVGYTVGVTQFTAHEVAFKVRYARARHDYKVEQKLSK